MNAFSRSWTDRFGTVLITLEGATGRQHVLLIAALDHHQSTLETLQRLEPFKGRVTLAIVEHPDHVAPIREVIQAAEPRVVIALEPHPGIFTSGAALRLEPGDHLASTGLKYIQPEALPAWSSDFGTVFPDGKTAQSVVASLASSLGVSALACGIDRLNTVLESLLQSRLEVR